MSKFHKKDIKKGVYGELSKIEEELQEAYDAQEQGQDLMLLIELADMVGAIEGVAKTKFGFSLEQLQKFAKLRSEVAIEEETEVKRKEVERLITDPISTLEGLADILLSDKIPEYHLKLYWKFKDGFSIDNIQKSINNIKRKNIEPANEIIELMNELPKILERKDNRRKLDEFSSQKRHL